MPAGGAGGPATAELREKNCDRLNLMSTLGKNICLNDLVVGNRQMVDLVLCK